MRQLDLTLKFSQANNNQVRIGNTAVALASVQVTDNYIRQSLEIEHKNQILDWNLLKQLNHFLYP
jgi:DUF971 family protein